MLLASTCVCCEIAHLIRVTSIGVCMLVLPGPGPKMRTSTWFQTQTFNAFNLQTLRTYKPSNSQTFKLLTSQTFELYGFLSFKLSKFENFKPSTPESLKLCELSKFEAFKFSNFQISWVSKFQTPRSQTFELEPEGCSVSLYASPAVLRFQAGFLFKLSNSKLGPTLKLETLLLSYFKLFILQTFQTFKLSNLVQHVIRSNSQKFEFEKPHS